ncbi:hypothetical protein JW926_13710 [Candidatus Sumerlaeota bacterium]|nr:hypothetical protein [Candidatus Sumerlaeota bacterium]
MSVLKIPVMENNPAFFMIFLFLTAFLFVFIPPSLSSEVPFFPVFSFENNDNRNEWECNFLYPFFHIMKSDGKTELIMPILFSLVKDTDPKTLSIDFLWPIFTWRLKPRPGGEGYKSQVFIFPLFFRTIREKEDSVDKKSGLFPVFFWGKDRNANPYFIAFPFFWYAKESLLSFPFSSTRPQTYLAFMPFFGSFKNLAGNEAIHTYLWPLFVKIDHKDRDKYFFLWPFFGYGTGENYKAYRFWPLFTWSRKPGGSIRCNYLWPLGYHRRIIRGEGMKTRFDMFFPLYIRYRSPKEKWDHYAFIYGRRETPARRQWALFWPLFKTAFFPESGARHTTLFLILFENKNDPQDRIFQLFPFYGRREKPKKIRSFWFWPIYHYKYDDRDSYTFTRKYLFPFYFKKEWVRENDEIETRSMLFPFYAKKVKSQGSWDTSGLHVFYHDKAEAVERNWCSLFPFYKSRGKEGEDYSVRIFWKLYHKGRKDGRRFWSVNPLIFQWKSEEEKREFNLLGGLFGIKKSPVKTSLKLFFIPLSKHDE